MNNYFELRVSINPEIEDIVSDICFTNFECEGVVLAEEAYKDLEMTSTTRGTLRVFLTELTSNPIEVLQTERELLKERGFSDEELGSWEITLDEKENQDWSKKWKEKWTVTHVTDKVTIVPSWIEYTPKKGEIIINIDPGCAFGTGTHQTTQLCMVGLEKYLKQGDKVADIGTGSGILAIYAMKLGASSAFGCDNDETVIDVCRENARINGLQVYPPLEGGSKSVISGWGEKHAVHKYPTNHIDLAKSLRNNATGAEQILWQYLRKSNLGIKFRRQQPVDKFIVDFMSAQAKIIIELDGGQHNTEENKEKDYNRDTILTNKGYTVIRIWNNDIFNNILGVLDYILSVINDPTRKSKIFTLPQGEGNERQQFEVHEADKNNLVDLSLCSDSNCDLLPFIPPQGEDIPNVRFELCTADKLTEKYDFVCANILHNVLAEIMGDLKNIMKDGGLMSLSGILQEKKPIVLEAIERESLTMVDTITQDQWISFVVKK